MATLPPQKQHLENILPEKFLHGFGALRWIPYLFIDVVNKINRKGTVQQRVLIVTDSHVYSCLPNDGDVQRCFPIAEITEIFVYQRGNEVGIQCPADYDYLFQLRSAGSLQQFLTVMEGRKVTQCNTPVQQSHTLSIEKPAQYTRVTPAPLMVNYTRVHRNMTRNLSMTGKGPRGTSFAAATSPGKDSAVAGASAADGGASGQAPRQLRYDDSVNKVAAGPEDSRRFEQAFEPEKKEWNDVTTDQGNSSVVNPSFDEVSAASHSPRTGDNYSQSPVGNRRELMSPQQPLVASPRGVPITPRVRADGSVLTTDELLQFERNRNINYRKMMAELIAAEREASSVLRQVIDDLRAEVDRLSVENMKLKHPTLEF